MIFEALTVLVIVFLMLRKSGAVKRHILAFFVAGICSGVVAFAIFEMTHPYQGYASGARFDAAMQSLGSWIFAVVAGIALGSIAAKVVRPKTANTPPQT